MISMKKVQTQYVCRECGRTNPKYMGRCPGCGGLGEEVRLFCLSRSARYVVVDERLSPVQKSTLEKLTGATVWDRPFVIMKIFERRAVTAEARLQVEDEKKPIGSFIFLGPTGVGKTELDRKSTV